MSENLNWVQKMKRLFDGFEPEANPNWDMMEKSLDRWANGQSLHEEFARRARAAERFALGATSLAAGLALWISLPYIFEDDEVEAITGIDSQVFLNSSEVNTTYVANFDEGFSSAQVSPGQTSNEEILRTVKLDPGLQSRGMMGRRNGLISVGAARTSNIFVVNAMTSEDEASSSLRAENRRILSFKDLDSEGAQALEEQSSSRQNFDAISGDNPEDKGSRTSIISNSRDLDSPASHRPSDAPTSGKPLTAAWTSSESEGSDAVSDAMGNSMSTGAVEVSVQEACAGTEIEFALAGIDVEGSVLWNFGDGSFSQESAPSHLYENAGTYDITVSIRAHGDGTIRTRTVENMIVVRPKPEAQMSWEFANAKPGMATVQLLDETLDASSSTWFISDEKLGQSMAELNIPGEYSVHLIASNSFGCQDVSAERIWVGDRKDAIAPAMFSPNGDGRYDTFMPMVVAELNRNWKLVIQDAKGQVVFETSNANRPWNGNLKNGQKAAEGSKFLWMLHATSPSGHHVLYADELKIEG